MAENVSVFDTAPYKTARFNTVASNGGNNIVKVGAGHLQAITFSQRDAAPTAGILTIYDNTTIYGTVATMLFTHNQTTAVFMPMTVFLNAPFSNGLSIGFTTMSDVDVILTYK